MPMRKKTKDCTICGKEFNFGRGNGMKSVASRKSTSVTCSPKCSKINQREWSAKNKDKVKQYYLKWKNSK